MSDGQALQGSTECLPATDDGITRAAAVLAAGGLVAFPTETVYGLGADATNDMAVARVFSVKGRPDFNPLIVHAESMDRLAAHGVFDDRAEKAASAFWPGPLTLVVPRRTDSAISLLATAGLDSVAVRVPDHPAALALMSRFGKPIVAPSANRSGRLSPTEAADVAASAGAGGLAGGVDIILDGGRCRVGVESTVIDLTGTRPALLRAGGYPAEEIAAVLGDLEDRTDTASGERDGSRPRSPGQLLAHYAPATPVVLGEGDIQVNDAVLGFGPLDLPPVAASINLSPSGDLTEAAAALFGALRRLDAAGCARIVAMPVPDHGLGRAINDRLRRAASSSR